MGWNRLLQPPILSALDCGTECGRCDRKGWRLRRALQAVLARGVISGRALEVLVGHITWSVMVKREGFAILDNVYTHIQAHYNIHAPLCSAGRMELFQVMGVLPLLRAHTRAAWHDRLTMSDASPFGIGVVDRQVEGEAIGVIGRCVEKWRFHAESIVVARRSALGTSPGTSNHVFIKEHVPQLHNAVGSFAEVPPDLLQASKVNMLHAARTHRTEHITRTWGRALAWGLCHVFRHRGSKPCRALFSVDNMVLCLAANKGWSSSPLLKPTLHLIAAYSLATGSHIAVRWIPSGYNPSDGPSRGKRPDVSSWSQPRAVPATEDGASAGQPRLRGVPGALRPAATSPIGQGAGDPRVVPPAWPPPGLALPSGGGRASCEVSGVQTPPFNGGPLRLDPAPREPADHGADAADLLDQGDRLRPVVLVAPPGLELPGRVGRDAPHRLRRCTSTA